MKIIKRYTDGLIKCNGCGHWREPKWILGKDAKSCLTCSGFDPKRMFDELMPKDNWEEWSNTREYICLGCGRRISYDKRRLKKIPKYCTRECAVENRLSSNRSKNEIHFYNLCRKNFVDVVANPRIFNGFDCDVLIRPLKIAILWDGKHHRQKIYKGQVLSKTKARDAVRIREIRKAGYIPYTIQDDGRENKEFVVSQFKKFLLVYPELT